MSFNHENLKVYQLALDLNTRVSVWIVDWHSMHSISNPLPWAAGSMLENIAMGSAAYSGMKIKSLDYALECRACLPPCIAVSTFWRPAWS